MGPLHYVKLSMIHIHNCYDPIYEGYQKVILHHEIVGERPNLHLCPNLPQFLLDDKHSVMLSYHQLGPHHHFFEIGLVEGFFEHWVTGETVRVTEGSCRVFLHRHR